MGNSVMKKHRLFSILLSFILVLSTSFGIAAAPSVQLMSVPDTVETTAIKNSVASAIRAGDPKKALPNDIKSKLDANLKDVEEFVTAKLVGDFSGIASATVNLQFPTKYRSNQTAVILFGVPNVNTTKWINVNGIIENDGSISMILNSTVLETLKDKTFALMVLSGESSATASTNSISATSSVSSANSGIEDNSITFTPTITIALKIRDWLSSGTNRALLAFSLGANAADDAVSGKGYIIFAFMQNPVFVGKDANSNNLIAATITEDEMVFVYYSPTEQKASVFTVPNSNGISLGTISLESAIANTCSEYYRVKDEEMATAIAYIKSILD